MQKAIILCLILAFCLMSSYTVNAQSTGYGALPPGTKSSNYSLSEEEQYGGEKEYEEKYEEEYEEEYEEQYEEVELEEDGNDIYYYDEDMYEEEEGYKYPNHTSNTTYGSSGNSSYGYSQGQGYSGSYDSSNPSSIPQLPPSLLTGFVVDIHFLAVDPTVQYIAYHYCSDLDPGYTTQCVIYNGTDSNSRLLGIEIVVSGEVFKALPLEERKLYHSHAFAVKSGLLVLPGVPLDQELSSLSSIIGSYGKVIDVWHSFQTFPVGVPKLAFGITANNQIDEAIADELDKQLNVGSTWKERRENRKSLKVPKKIEGADDWLTSGEYTQWVAKKFTLQEDSS